MGRDKALVSVGGRVMAGRVADALTDAGAHPVVCIGGDGPGLAEHGLTVVPDDEPGVGPLGGVVTAARWAVGLGAEVVVVAGCDHPRLDGPSVARLLSGLAASPCAVAVPLVASGPPAVVAGRPHALVARGAALLTADRRALSGLLSGPDVAVVAGLDPDRLADADSPDDLP